MSKSKEAIEKEITELEEKIAVLKEELREFDGKVFIEWQGACDRRQHGKPYLAILTKGENGQKYHYDFLPTVDEWDYKGRNVKSIYQGELPIGTILRGRQGSSWKNDHTYFYVVNPKGLEEIDEHTALQKLDILQ